MAQLPQLFEAERVALHAFEPEDLPVLHAYLNRPELVNRRYLPGGFPDAAPLSRKQVEGIIAQWAEEKNGFHLAVVLRASQALVGHADCEWGWDPHSPFVSVLIAPAHQHHHYASEALDMILRFLFENTPAHNVSGTFADWNTPAREFARRFGFSESGRWRRSGLYQGEYYDTVLVDILRPEWIKRKGG
jgi:RimJ/RimL family protein N-acetyltransferase